MFKSRKSAGGGPMSGFSSKIAHTTILPSLGNKDLRTLQDFITAEKGAISGLQKLSLDWGRAADALRTWGSGEGDDLGDIFTHAASMLFHISKAMDQYVVHEQSIRTHLKSIRTKEEELDELRKRRRNVGSKAESAEKKLSKMGQEHKGLQEQTDLLTRLREEMRYLDMQIITDELRLGDFKRQVSKEFLALKFGGLLQFAEKAAVVGEIGKLLIEEIPLDTSTPGQPRPYYNAYERTSNYSEEVTRCVGEVKFDPPTYVLAPAASIQNPQSASGPDGKGLPPHLHHQQPHTMGGYMTPPIPNSPYTLPHPSQHAVGQPGYNHPVGEFGEAPLAPIHQQHSTIAGLPLSTGSVPQQHGDPPPLRSSQDHTAGAVGGHFATFPHSGPRRDVPELQSQPSAVPLYAPKPEVAFSETVADVLAADTYLRNSVDGAPRESNEDSAYGGISDPKGDIMTPNPWDDNNKLVSAPIRVDSRNVTGLPYTKDAAAAGRRGKGSSDFNYPYEDNGDLFCSKSCDFCQTLDDQETSTVRPDIVSQAPPVSNEEYSPPPPAAGNPDEEANAAASREAAREINSLGFQANRGRSNTRDGVSVSPTRHPGLPSRQGSRPASPSEANVPPSLKNEPESLSSQLPPQPFVPSNAPPLINSPFGSSPYNQPLELRVRSGSGSLLPLPLVTTGPLGARTVSAGAFRRQASRPPPPESEDENASAGGALDVSLASTTPLQLRKKALPTLPGSSPSSTNPPQTEFGSDIPSNTDSPPSYSKTPQITRDSPGQPKVDSLLANEEEFMRELESEPSPVGSGGLPYTQPLPAILASRDQGKGNIGSFSAGYGSGKFSTNLE
ncbi:Eisosome component PIL1-domain-containing protein [Cantharellus anzutake]|uniref:Eisosome component PIL1-domain-containing protein n=1 Tax=Cantharellus anzutake TaxID=1750568 RepID=UPI0019043494|nr:Eisosome component PIL1-domain-containing protein [Cantharellus anzutake]KAF8330762.1 Eisosome component PIL1-domain-containing protein [Cantharellus anzutake]